MKVLLVEAELIAIVTQPLVRNGHRCKHMWILTNAGLIALLGEKPRSAVTRDQSNERRPVALTPDSFC